MPQYIIGPVTSRPNRDYKGHLVIKVKCPYCNQLHSHGVKKDMKGIQSRVADCGKGEYYITIDKPTD